MAFAVFFGAVGSKLCFGMFLGEVTIPTQGPNAFGRDWPD